MYMSIFHKHNLKVPYNIMKYQMLCATYKESLLIVKKKNVCMHTHTGCSTVFS